MYKYDEFLAFNLPEDYYVVEETDDDEYDEDDEYEDEDDDNKKAVYGIMSLDALRKELDYMYPAIKAIYDELEATRDTEEALTGGIADILYVWCSMTYAAREPIFTEDGPVNCWWEHPDNMTDSEENKQKYIKEVQRANVSSSEPVENFTYNDKLQAEGEGYVIDIPDGFIIKEGDEDRDFIAYLPNEDDTDDEDESRFIIYAGQKIENEIIGKLRTYVEYVEHFNNARDTWLSGLINVFKQQQEEGDADVAQLKKDIKNVLRNISQYVEEELKRAELIYTLKRIQYPESDNLCKMREAVESLVELSTQCINLDEQQIKAESEFAKDVETRFNMSANDSADQIMNVMDDTYNKSAVQLLSKLTDGTNETLVEEE